MKKFLGLFVLLLGFGQMTATEIVVPERVKFCDLSLTLDKGARTYIKDFIGKLRRSPSHFQSLVNRCDLHMPVVEQALDEAGVPQDLKFLAIQESSFNGGAVSKSGAIGYWQFKEPAAREVGLVINRQMDERKHLYRASIGAARYLFRINRDFNNWLYAVVGYNRGPVGAKAYISPKYYGKKQMPITSKTHWYALKAIAYKLAFQHELGKGTAKTRLELRSAEGEASVKRLAAKWNVDVETFKKHNQWVKGDKVPDVVGLQCLVPVEGAGPIAQVKEKIKPPKAAKPKPKPKVGGGAPKSKPKPPATSVRNTRRFTYLNPAQDPDHGKEYAILKKNEKVVEVAVRYRKKVAKLNAYNGFEVYSRPEAGTVIRLKPASKMRFHIVRPGENWRSIAKEHELDQKKLMKANRTRQLGSKLYPGQKVYLKGKKPKGEKVILLDVKVNQPLVRKTVTSKPKAKPQTKPKVKPVRTPESKPAPKPSRPRSQGSKGAVHKVKAGETLWRISQRYGMSVDELKRMNRLRSNEIHVGQVLKVKRK